MSLTIQLLADAVSKGGPGSGPHAGSGSNTSEEDHASFMSRKAGAAERRADREPSKANHLSASQAHNAAFKANSKAGRLTGIQRFKDQAKVHQDKAADHARKANLL